MKFKLRGKKRAFRSRGGRRGKTRSAHFKKKKGSEEVGDRAVDKRKKKREARFIHSKRKRSTRPGRYHQKSSRVSFRQESALMDSKRGERPKEERKCVNEFIAAV